MKDRILWVGEEKRCGCAKKEVWSIRAAEKKPRHCFKPRVAAQNCGSSRTFVHSFAVGEIAIDRACPFKRIFIEGLGRWWKKNRRKDNFLFSAEALNCATCTAGTSAGQRQTGCAIQHTRW